ncbi:MAG: SpoIIIAH-like family protein [Eubacterium sp.]
MSKNNKKEKKAKPVLTEEELKKRKSRKTKAAISCFILLLGVGVAGNWYWENSDLSTKVSTISSDSEKILGEATYVDATTESTTENSYFSDARIERQSARDESLEKLQKIIDSSKESDSAHKEAAEKIASISDMISIENKIETLVKAKGVNNCLAVINEDGTKVDVIVDVDELSDTVILQIKEIATAQLGCSYENVTIIQSN